MISASFAVCIVALLLVILGSIAALWWSHRKPDAPYFNIPYYRLWYSTRGPIVLFGFRLFSLMWNLGTQIAFLCVLGFEPYIFYTIWNYTLLIIYFAIATGVSAVQVYHYYKTGSWNYSEEEKVTLLGKVMIILFEICVPLVFLVDVVLWTILLPYATKYRPEQLPMILNFFSYNQHGTNILFMMVEFFLNALPFYRGHVFVVVLWAGAYGIFAWILHAYTGFYAYPFLETEVPEAVGWYIGMCVGHMLFYVMVYGLHKAKIRWCSPPVVPETLPLGATDSRGDFAPVPLDDEQ